MTRLILSLGSIVLAVALLASGTIAFFSDTESATGNTFAAGALDLLIDNESYYNGNVCTDVDDSEEGEDWQWQGDSPYPVPGTPCTTSFYPSNLDDGLLFFNFNDVKPDDEGEDTISIHTQNDAWVCMDMTLTSDDDLSSNEPELNAGDDEEDGNNPFDGELASGIEFFWWADDGDNVYEVGENSITDGVVSLASLENVFPVALADSENNVWGEQGPIPGEETVYIAKAWCMGDLTLDAVADDGGVNPSVDPGVICDGTGLGNIYQTDGATLDIEFSAIQARNNNDFLCEPPDEIETGSITIDKIVTFSNDQITVNIANFHLFVDDGVNPPVQLLDQVQMNNLPPGTYEVSENYVGGQSITFDAQFSGDCSDDGDTGTIVLAANDDANCQLLNVITVNN